MRNGHTLLELIVAMLLAATVAGSLLPAVTRYRHRAAVVAARESVAGLLAEARAVAPAFAGAIVKIESGPWRAWIQLSDSGGRLVRIEEDTGVQVILSGGRSSTEVEYDALALGRVASETLLFRLDGEDAGLTISSFGRVRRW